MKTKTTRAPELEAPAAPESPDSQSQDPVGDLSSDAQSDPTTDPSERAGEIAALILEVLAGARSAGEAADAIGVSLTRYYLIERRAVDGLVAACKEQPRGPRRDPEREIDKLRLEVARLEKECLRSQSLLRISQRSAALGAVLTGKEKPLGKSERKRRRRRKAARALILAKGLRQRDEEKPVAAPSLSKDNGKEVSARER